MKRSNKQKMYRMKGCSKTKKNNIYLGGSADVNLAYPSTHVPTIPNTNLAYNPSSNNKVGGKVDISRAYPSKGPDPSGFNFLNSNSQNGGGCGCGLQLGGGRHRMGCKCSMCRSKMHKGGSLLNPGVATGASIFNSVYACSSDKGCTDNAGVMGGGGAKLMGGVRHRSACSCSSCKSKMRGGSNVSNNGLPYPDGLLGQAWTPNVTGWPGVDGVSMNRNHLGYNNYIPNDVSRQMIDVGPAPPFLGGTYLGGSRRRIKKSSTRRRNKNQKGGILSNFFTQDLINLGRQFQFNSASSYNAIRGHASPINPMPWKDQMIHKSVQLP